MYLTVKGKYRTLEYSYVSHVQYECEGDDSWMIYEGNTYISNIWSVTGIGPEYFVENVMVRTSLEIFAPLKLNYLSLLNDEFQSLRI